MIYSKMNEIAANDFRVFRFSTDQSFYKDFHDSSFKLISLILNVLLTSPSLNSKMVCVGALAYCVGVFIRLRFTKRKYAILGGVISSGASAASVIRSRISRENCQPLKSSTLGSTNIPKAPPTLAPPSDGDVTNARANSDVGHLVVTSTSSPRFSFQTSHNFQELQLPPWQSTRPITSSVLLLEV